MAELFRYAAFISYSSKDARFAQHLHKTLEAYGIPSALGKFDLIGGGKTNRIYPVFRDREELSAGDLGERIEAALKASANLIVVCSPNSAASPWVEKEIQFFAGLGRREKIFAIIPDNAPLTDETGADATPSCFPPAFRGDALAGTAALEPLAADARKGKDGFRNAWLKVVAGMIGVTPGQIIDRDRRRRARRNLWLTCGGAAAALLIAYGFALTDARIRRSDHTARALEIVGRDKPLDAVFYALGGLPARGDLLTPTHSDAAEALDQTGALGLSTILGTVVDYGFSSDSRFLLTVDPEQNGVLRDLHSISSVPELLGKIGGFSFAPRDPYVIITDQNGSCSVLELSNAKMPRRTLGRLAGTLFAESGRYLLTFSVDGLGGTLYDIGESGLVPISSVAGPVRDAAFSGDGRYLLTILGDEAGGGEGILRDLAHPAASSRFLGPLFQTTFSNFRHQFGYRFSDDGKLLITQATNSVGTLYVLKESSTDEITIGKLPRLFVFPGRGDFLLVKRPDGPVAQATLLELRSDIRQRYEIGKVGEYSFSADGRWLVTEGVEQWALHDLNNLGSPPHPLGRVKASSFSASSRFLITQGFENETVVHDLKNLSVPPLSLGLVESFQFSQDGDILITASVDGVSNLRDLSDPAANVLSIGRLSRHKFAKSHLFARDSEGLGKLYSLTDLLAQPVLLGRVEDLLLADNGRFAITIDRDGSGALRDLNLLAYRWESPRTTFCAASGDVVLPRPPSGQITRPDTSADLVGRPWNPCDWRGLGAIFPSAEHGDGWFEGPRQWLRLMHVRYFGGKDWACAETTSRASAETRAARADMCARFAGSAAAPSSAEE